MALTDGDLKNIKDLIEVTIDENETLARKTDLAFLPTKDEFYEQTGEIIKELKAMREEHLYSRLGYIKTMNQELKRLRES